LEPLRLNAFGDIENWPENFFGDEMADLTARTVAAARRYSFQNIFEEAGGNLPSYTSFWSDVEITGVY